MPKTPPTHKLAPIEGLRGYLAMMVMISHIFVFGAYVHIPVFFHTSLGGVLEMIDHGGLAVNCFMIVSGFVIFMLVDTKKEPYRIFILRRFLRIFPVYLLLFFLSMPCLLLSDRVLDLTHRFQSERTIEATRHLYEGLWNNVWFHVPLHLALLQGVVPTTILPNSGTAFLGPAWSLSLEWQFYLIAPFWCALFLTKRTWARLAMFVVCLLFIVKSHYFFSSIDQGGFLPLQVPFFLAGGVSHFIYSKIGKFSPRPDTVLPVAVLLSLGIYQLTDKSLPVIPLMVWLVVFALLLEPQESFSFRVLSPIFTNRFTLWMGKTSYSIYLSHALVLVTLQYLVLRYVPAISQGHLLLTLLVLTPLITLPLSGLLYRTIEAPCIQWGKRITGENPRVIMEWKSVANR